MSTEEDGPTLTRKQLRELRLTGSTPVISGEEAAAAQPVAAESTAEKPAEPALDEPADQDPTENPAPARSGAPLTRRAARAQERTRTGPVPTAPGDEQPLGDEPVVDEPVVDEPVVEEPVVEEPVVVEPVVEEPVAEEPIVDSPELVSGIPTFAPRSAQTPGFDAPTEPAEPAATIEAERADEPRSDFAAPEPTATADDDQPERPMVGAAFGIGVKRSPSGHGAPTAFDDLLDTGSAGAHKTASTLIFTPSPGAGSLSGPVASTGELLITGTYALPEGMGSQGHALGTTDGKDIDAVLIDGELAPASSPTPIAASSAISTSKPAGEVIRPPVPDKGNKLTLTLAIVAGGLALALAAALIIAFTTGVLG
ncbi:hypothetical protein AB0N64_12945 [Microbacterium sp. NPDC089318]